MRKKIMTTHLLLLFFGVLLIQAREEINSASSATMKNASVFSLISQDATKRVFVPHEDIGNNWRDDISFTDSTWLLCQGAPGGVGYEKSSGYEDLISLDMRTEMSSDASDPNPSCYIRIPFNVDSDSLASILYLHLGIRYDDGFKAYINGNLVAEANAPDPTNWNSFSSGLHEADEVTQFNISEYLDYLVAGPNLLAIQGMNDNNRSSDFLITAELSASDNLYGDFASSNMPIFHIYTNGQAIPDEPKIDVIMKVINNGPGQLNHPADPPTDYDGNIGIEIRGAYSSTFPLKPYGVETRDVLGEDSSVTLLGMPKESDWTLTANYNEKSFVRHSLSYHIFRKMGHYSTRNKLCEVFINDVYQGIYLFTEKIKRDKNRVDISKLRPEENTGDDLTGGYIIEKNMIGDNDYWLSNFHPPGHPDRDVYFLYFYPKATKITDEQKTYIQDFIDTVQIAIFGDQFADPESGYRKYLDVPSFIDYLIVNEVARNGDGYHKSRFFYKDKNSKDGLLYAGPVWDFDWAWKDIGSSVTNGEGWKYDDLGNPNQSNSPGWYVIMMRDGYFTNQLIDRYFELRTNVLDLDNIYAYIDSVVAHVGSAQERHFDLWPIDEGYMAPEPRPYVQSYEEEIVKLKTWIDRRLNWLDDNFPLLKDKITTEIPDGLTSKVPLTTSLFNNYPNPFNPQTTIEFSIGKYAHVSLDIYNSLGQKVATLISQTMNSGQYKTTWNAVGMPSGVYFYILSTEEKVLVRKMLLIR